MNKIDIETGHRISKFRKEIGLTQKQLAKELGVSQQIVANYELGQRRLHISLLTKIAKTLYVSVYDLLGIVQNKNKPGPISKIQKRIEQIKELPKVKQLIIIDFLDTIIKSEQKVS